jgi:hypothetical protein
LRDVATGDARFERMASHARPRRKLGLEDVGIELVDSGFVGASRLRSNEHALRALRPRAGTASDPSRAEAQRVAHLRLTCSTHPHS